MDIRMRRLLLLALVLVLAGAGVQAFAQKSQNSTVRSVQGVVTDGSGNAISGAVVHLKNTKTLQIRSFITKDDGSYAFHGLSTNVDYELRAEYNDASSDVRTLSVFDSRSKAVINLKINKK
jgi:hypothetical protein